MRWLAALLGWLVMSASASAEPAPLSAYLHQPRQAPDATVHYGEARAQIVEVFLPKGQGPHPVVILLHGGCYQAELQGLRETSGIARDLAMHGLAVWNVEYRKLGEAGAGYPGTFQDVAAGVDRIREDAGRYHLDPKRVIVVGHSAGGHLALWAAARAKLPKSSPLYRAHPLHIATAVSMAGIGDLEGQANVFSNACGAETFPRLLGPTPSYGDTSPVRLLPTGSRTVMVHGVFDHVMPPFTGQAYAEKVRKAGDPAQVVVIPDAGHFDVVIPTTPAWKSVRELVLREIRALPTGR